MPEKLTLALLILAGVAIPMSVEGTQDRDDGFLTIGEIINIDIATRTLEMESAPVGVLKIERRSRPGGALGVGDLNRFPPPGQPRGPNDGRIELPECLDDVRIEPPEYPLRCPLRGIPPVAVVETTDPFPIGARQVRQGYRGFNVSIDNATELMEEGQAIDFTSLAPGDRITVLGRIDGANITAYQITRSLPLEEEED